MESSMLGSESHIPDSIVETASQQRFEILQNVEGRKELKLRVERLVQRVHDQEVQTVIFLDKSARPVSWLFRELWKQHFSDQPSPDIRFVNIGQGLGAHESVPLVRTAFENKRIPEGIFRRQFHKEKRLPENVRDPDVVSQDDIAIMGEEDIIRLQEAFRDQFDGKKILVVDEVVSSGETLLAAINEIGLAFPKATEVKGVGLGTPHEQMKMFPWVMQSGFAGVLELEDDIFARPLTKETLAQASEIIKRKLKNPDFLLSAIGMLPNEKDSIRVSFEGLRSSLDAESDNEFDDPDFKQKLKQLVDREAMLLEQLESLRDFLKAYPSYGSGVPRPEIIDQAFHGMIWCYEIKTLAYDLLVLRDLEQYASVPWGIFNKIGNLYRIFDGAMFSTFFGDGRKRKKMMEEFLKFKDSDKMIMRAQSLRKEMKALAKETFKEV